MACDRFSLFDEVGECGELRMEDDEELEDDKELDLIDIWFCCCVVWVGRGGGGTFGGPLFVAAVIREDDRDWALPLSLIEIVELLRPYSSRPRTT